MEGQVFAYPWDGGSPLSAIADDSNLELTERKPHRLLRPVYINAVEVGFAYQQVDRDRRLHVRGVIIALWYFISKGHQAIALLPHCFKIYTSKSSNWAELMHLFRMNLIEFTPGFGSEKYIEVNRILATRARETGGCVVARSQMHAILDEIPQLDKTIEKRLLMPAFNGDDLIFPMDGPLGRNGPTLNLTLCCDENDIEWGRCSHHQLTLQDQRTWIRRLAAFVASKATWTALALKLDNFEPTTSLDLKNLPIRPSTSLHFKVRPPESNPPDGRGFSHVRRAMRRNGQDLYYLPSPGGDLSTASFMAPSSRTMDEFFLPGYAQDSASLEKSSTTRSDENNPINDFPGGMEGSFQRNGILNGGFRPYQNNRYFNNHYGNYSQSGRYSRSVYDGNRRRIGGQPYWQQKDFPGNGDGHNGFMNGGGFNRYRFNDDCRTCSNCRHSCSNRAQPLYERRYDQRKSDRFFERLRSVDDFPAGRNGQFTPIHHNDLFEEGDLYGLNSTNHREIGPSLPINRDHGTASFEELPTSDTKINKEVFDQVAAILGWEKAKMITERYSHVHSVQRLIEYAFEDPETPSDSISTSARVSQPDEPNHFSIEINEQPIEGTAIVTAISPADPIEDNDIGSDNYMENVSLNIPDDQSTAESVETSLLQQVKQSAISESVETTPTVKLGTGWMKLRQKNDKKPIEGIVVSRRRLRGVMAQSKLEIIKKETKKNDHKVGQSISTESVYTAVLALEELPLIDLSFSQEATSNDEQRTETPSGNFPSTIPAELLDLNF